MLIMIYNCNLNIYICILPKPRHSTQQNTVVPSSLPTTTWTSVTSVTSDVNALPEPAESEMIIILMELTTKETDSPFQLNPTVKRRRTLVSNKLSASRQHLPQEDRHAHPSRGDTGEPRRVNDTMMTVLLRHGKGFLGMAVCLCEPTQSVNGNLAV